MTDKTERSGPRRGRWWRRGLVLAVILVAGYTLLGFVGIPLLIKRVGVERLAGSLEGTVTLQRAAFNPYTFRLVLEELEIADEAGRQVLAFDRFEGNYQLFKSLVRKGYHFRKAELVRPVLNAEIGPDGALNLRRIVRPAVRAGTAREPLREMPRIAVLEMGLVEADLSFRDGSLPEPFEAELQVPVARLDGFDTRPDHDNPIRLTATTRAGARLDWEGTFRADPLSARGTLSLTDVRLPQFMPYAQGYTDARVTDGRLSLELLYEAAPAAVPRVATVEARDAVIDGLRIEHSGEPWLSVPELRLASARLDADGRAIEVGQVTVNDPQLLMERDETGAMRSTRLVKQRLAAVKDGAPTGDEAAGRIDLQSIEYPLLQAVTSLKHLSEDILGPWSLAVAAVTVHRGAARFTDLTTAEPVKIAAFDLELTAGPLSSDKGLQVPIQLAMALEGGGRVQLAGDAAVDGRHLDLEVTTDELALAQLGPYLPRELPDPIPAAELREGRLFLEGHLVADRTADGALSAAWTGASRVEELRVQQVDGELPMATLQSIALNGETSVARPAGAAADLAFRGDLELRDGTAETPWLGRASYAFATAAARGIDLRTGERSLDVQRVELEAPMIRAEPVLLPRPSAEGTDDVPPPDVSAAGGRYEISVGELRITAGTFELRDEMTDPPAVILGDELMVRATDISTAGGTFADLELTTKVQHSGRLRVTGRIDPFPQQPAADLRIEMTGLPLDPYDPFSGRYLGYFIDAGRLSLTMPVTVESGRVAGTLDLNLDQLALGERVDSPDAPDIPVKLGLDLLRDARGRIEVSIPIAGDMTDPGFSFGGLVMDAFLGVLVKATTAPFQLIGSIFGAGADEDLSKVTFAPGTADLTAASLTTLDVLGRALVDRPGLSLRVTGRYSTQQDLPVMRVAMLRDEVLRQIQRTRPGVQALRADDYNREIGIMYRREVAQNDQPVLFEQMEAALAARIEVPAERLQSLIRQRAERVAGLIGKESGVAPDRVEPVTPPPAKAEADAPIAAFELY